jgi:hypothetical protein
MPSKTKLLVFLLMCGIATNLTAQTAKNRPYLGKVNGVHKYSTAADFLNNLVANDYGPRLNDQNDHWFISQGNGLTEVQDSIPKGVITVEYFQDNEYYVFHRADGSIVKKVRYDSFPDHSPFANLEFDWDEVGYGTKSNIGGKTFQEKKQRFNTINLDIVDSVLSSCYEIRKYRPNILKPCGEFDSMNYVLSISSTFLDLANEDFVRFDNIDIALYDHLGNIIYQKNLDQFADSDFFCVSNDGKFLIMTLLGLNPNDDIVPQQYLGIINLNNNHSFVISLNDIFPSTTFNDRFLIYRNDRFFDCFTTGYISKPDYFERYLFHFHFVPSERCFYQRQVKLSATEVNMDILQIKNFASDLLNTLTHDELIKHSGYIKSNY